MSRNAAPPSLAPPAAPAAQAPLVQGWRPGFWQRPTAQNILPLVTSLAIHAAIILAAIGGLRAYHNMSLPRAQQVIIPDAAIVAGAPVGGIPNPGLGGDPHAAPGQNVDSTIAASENWAQRRSESLANSLMSGASGDAADSVIGLGPRSAVAGVGSAALPGPGGATALAPFGVPGGGQTIRPQSQFMGISGNAERIVYVCDASGSMSGVFWRVRDELDKAISTLRPAQAFNVFFFSDGGVIALDSEALVMASPVNKRRAFELTQKTSENGSTDPLPAIRMAFAQEPQLIYVLTDGFDLVHSLDAVVAEFRRLNADKRVKVNTILIRSRDDLELEAIVRTIAQENGGSCRVVDRKGM